MIVYSDEIIQRDIADRAADAARRALRLAKLRKETQFYKEATIQDRINSFKKHRLNQLKTMNRSI